MSGRRETFRAATSPPESGAVRPFQFPDISSQSLDSGRLIKTARLSRLPVVTTKLVLDAGEARVSSARAGLAVLTGDALEGGTLRRTGAELAEALENIGAGLGISTAWDYTVVALTCLAERLEEALGLLAEVVLEPAFPADEVERIRDQRLAVIEQRRMDPARLAADSLVHLSGWCAVWPSDRGHGGIRAGDLCGGCPGVHGGAIPPSGIRPGGGGGRSGVRGALPRRTHLR